MTGRDLIAYILKNHLEDEPVVQNDKIIGFITVEEAAEKFDVGVATVNVWYRLGNIDGVCIGEQLLIFADAKPVFLMIKENDHSDKAKEPLDKYLKEHYKKECVDHE